MFAAGASYNQVHGQYQLAPRVRAILAEDSRKQELRPTPPHLVTGLRNHRHSRVKNIGRLKIVEAD